MAKIGVLGFRGRLGSFLVKNGAEPIEADITLPESLRSSNINDFDVVINCAALTGVDDCEHSSVAHEYYKRAVQVNSRALEHIRKEFPGRLIHISSDYVFKGDKGPYIENDKRDPVNDYGWTKLGGEIVLETFPENRETVIVRTTGLYGSGYDFASYVLDSLRKGEKVLASRELKGNQTYIPHLAKALFHISQMTLPDVVNIFHVGSIEVISRYQFAMALANLFGFDSMRVLPCHNREIHNWIATRPTNGGLVVRKAANFGIPLFEIYEGLDTYKRVGAGVKHE